MLLLALTIGIVIGLVSDRQAGSLNVGEVGVGIGVALVATIVASVLIALLSAFGLFALTFPYLIGIAGLSFAGAAIAFGIARFRRS